MPASEIGWKRIETEAEFLAAFGNKTFVGEAVRFTIHADGTMTGQVGEHHLDGTWHWEDRHFCRSATLAGRALGQDCETIEQAPGRMRYTRNRGRGTSTIVTIEPTRADRDQ